MADEKIVIFHHDCEGAVNHWSIVGELVRCKDCKWQDCCVIIDGESPGDFFCADGKRQELNCTIENDGTYEVGEYV